MKIIHTACTDTGLVRPDNQDYYRLLPEIGLFILADGMGGARGGAFASKLAADTVAQMMTSETKPDASSLMAAVEAAHHQVRTAATGDAALNGMGTTLVAALIHDGEVAIVSVGDSRAYRYGAGALHLLTEDQTWVRDVGIPMGLNESALKTHPMRHALTMAVGIDADLEARYYGTSLKIGDGILLSSDGLHGLVPAQQLAGIAGDSTISLRERCAKLIHAAHEAGGNDNITVVMLEAV